MKSVIPPKEPRHLAIVPTNGPPIARLTRAQVAARLGVSISSVRRYEGSRLHPHVDENDVRWFDVKDITALAAELANQPKTRRMRNADTTGTAAKSKPSRGELAALVFERFEQRQSLAEIVIGVRVDPETVRELFDQWCLGLTIGQLRMARTPNVPRRGEIARTKLEALAKHLAALPVSQVTRISVGRFRGEFQHDETEYAEVVELGGFHVSGPCTVEEITLRYGAGDCRITAYGFEPAGLRWEFLVEL